MNPLPEILSSFPVIDRQTAFVIGTVLGLIVGFWLYNIWRQQ